MWEWLQLARMMLTAAAGFALEVKDTLNTDHAGQAVGLGLLALVALEVILRRFSDPETPALPPVDR